MTGRKEMRYHRIAGPLVIASLSTWPSDGPMREVLMSNTERAQLLRESKPNSWIAMASDESRVVGRGSTYAEAVEAAEREGVEDPVLVKTPDEWLPLVL